MFRANLLNEKTGEMEEVIVCGYFGDSGFTSTDYAEIYKEEDGHYYAAPFDKLYANSNTVKDVVDMCHRTEKFCEMMNKIVNKGE